MVGSRSASCALTVHTLIRALSGDPDTTLNGALAGPNGPNRRTIEPLSPGENEPTRVRRAVAPVGESRNHPFALWIAAGQGRWVFGIRDSVLGIGRWALVVGRWALGVERWTLSVGRWALDVER